MTYQQQRYQSAVDQPVEVRPVVIPVVTGKSDQEDDGLQAIGACCGILGGFFIVGFLIVLAIVRRDGGTPLWVLGSLGGICSVLGCCCIVMAENSSDGSRQEIHNNTQPVSEPFTQSQMNQGTPMYVPVHSGPGIPYYDSDSDNGPSASYSGQRNNVQQHFQHGVHTATGAPQNFGSNKGNRNNSSQICRQWNDGPCSFGEMCRHRHVCSTCADAGKPGEKHKASSEECPNKERNASVQSGPGHQNPDNAPSASYNAQMSNVQQPFQHKVQIATGAPQNSGSNKGNRIKSSQICRQWNDGPCSFGEMCRHRHVCSTCADAGKPGEKHKASSEECPNKERIVPGQSDPGNQNTDNAPSASYSGQMSNVQQPSQHGVPTATGAPQNIGGNKGKIIKSSQICRQWNDGPCSFGPTCRHLHVCIACADTGKPGEKHKASSEECPNEGTYVPVQSSPRHQNPDYAQLAAYYTYMSNMQQPSQHGAHNATGSPIIVPLVSGPEIPDSNDAPSVSYYAQMINVQQPLQEPFEHTVDPATGAPQNFGSNKGNIAHTPRTKSSQICRQWNEGPCSFGVTCRYRHVCSTCADIGKPGEKHKASSEECPKDGSVPQNSTEYDQPPAFAPPPYLSQEGSNVGKYDQPPAFAPPPYLSQEGASAGSVPQNSAEYDQPPAFAPPPYLSQEGSNVGSAPQKSGPDKTAFAEYDQPPAYAPPPYSSQEGSNAGRYVPVQSGSELPHPDFSPSAPYSAQMSNVQQPYQHGIDTSIGAPQHSWSDRDPLVEYDQPPTFDPPPYSAFSLK